ncbi:5-formyltetrahydrofolate cyclo-ligase [Candidatus Sumerlaeota bacterium]|nr:5-formyltetrahydrofolate cyclo-ligase [Candidatus Sumerlaeota bacterium]
MEKAVVAQKERIRQIYRNRREQLDPRYRHEASLAITDRLLAWEPVARATCVMTYLSFNAEVETFALVRRLFALGKSVAVPYIHRGAINLIPAQIYDLEHDLQTGPLGILEPEPDRLRPLDPKQIDVHVVPGIAFDERGFRIGYGKGHYDRFLLLRSPHSVVVGIAFGMEILKKLPHEDCDVPMDYVIAETGMIDCSVARRGNRSLHREGSLRGRATT